MPAASPVDSTTRRRIQPVTIAAILGVALAAAIGAWVFKPVPVKSPPVVTRFEVDIPGGFAWTSTGRQVIAVSPDGTRLAYVADRKLFMRALDHFDTTTVAGVIDPSEIFFSPDGQWIGFHADRKLQKVALTGGAPIPVATINLPFGATWTNGFIVFGQESGHIQGGRHWRDAERLSPPSLTNTSRVRPSSAAAKSCSTPEPAPGRHWTKRRSCWTTSLPRCVMSSPAAGQMGDISQPGTSSTAGPAICLGFQLICRLSAPVAHPWCSFLT